MTDSPKNARWELRLTLFFAGLLLGLLGATAVFVFSPKQYQGSATIQVKTSAGSVINSAEMTNAQKEIIRSKEILEPVVTAFQLTQKWDATPEKTLARLRHATTVEDLRNTELLQISVLNPDPQLAADLANAIGGQYQKLRIKDQGERALHLLNQLQAEVDAQRVKGDIAQKQFVDQRRDEVTSGVVLPRKGQPGGKEAYIQAKRSLEAAETRLSTERMQVSMPRAPVTIWELAEAPQVPSTPRVIPVFLAGILAGIVLGAVLAALVRSTPS